MAWREQRRVTINALTPIETASSEVENGYLALEKACRISEVGAVMLSEDDLD
jgi:hypothetical protein